ncbi:hypothetical protein ABB37_03235 [Leptomonas pyrrhocoris]|uniref:Uncharacterized protein n=1 Tax=Leptomonas pyrrhocoris TaxID=157538 RepID=A0A0N0VG10_LEPPY|nr:hypothetical protein ABB37_03235 [Leptomonas pyrrhocoris]KPA82078.1 hypothetical protein ABB37_03235 [Leptomonas pyrrhocoris]|eukprot:XP_015660517.1 hypothetical protein ABB37_03235 [Leptomonas pyrrhocoris]
MSGLRAVMQHRLDLEKLRSDLAFECQDLLYQHALESLALSHQATEQRMALEYEQRVISDGRRRCEQLRGEVRHQRAAVEDCQKQLAAQEKSQAAARQAFEESWERYRFETEEKRRSSQENAPSTPRCKASELPRYGRGSRVTSYPPPPTKRVRHTAFGSDDDLKEPNFPIFAKLHKVNTWLPHPTPRNTPQPSGSFLP